MKSRLVERIPPSMLGKMVTLLFLLLFLILPFQKPLLHKTLKGFSLSIIPSDLALPSYFSTKITIIPTDVLLIFLLALLMCLKRGEWQKFFWSGPSKYLSLLFITAFFSLGASSTSYYPLMYVRFFEIALVAVLFNGIRTAFDSQTIVPFITALAWLIFALSLFESVLALAQYFSQGRMGLKFLGECNRTYFSFHMPNGYTSQIDALFHIQRNSELLMRSTGTFPHPNIFGGFQFCAMLATFYLYFIQTIKKYKTLLLGGIFLQMLALTVSFSRAAFIALLLSTILYFILQARSQDKRKSVKQLALTLFIASAFCLTLFYPQLFARGGIVNYNSIAKGADSERLIYQKIALDMVKERPFLGIGLNNFQIESHRFFPNGRVLHSAVHNIYLLFAAETGLIGVSFFLLFLYSVMKYVRYCIRSDQGVFLLSAFIGLLFIGACDFYFIRAHGRILFFGIAALLYVVSKGLKVDDKPPCTA